jgi:hypothetical protein
MKKLKLFSLILLLSFSFLFAGAEWTMKTTVISKKKRNNSTSIMKIFTDGSNVKQIFEEIEGKRRKGFEGDEYYWLYKTGEDMIYIVNTKDKSYFPMSIDSILQMSQMVSKIVKFEIKDYNINKEVLSPEVVNGFKCNHIKLHITYKMKMKIAFIKKTFNVEEVKEIWATKDFKYFNDYNNPFIKKNFKTGFEELDKAIKEQIGMYKEIGFPIKTITISIQNKKETKTVTEVSNVQQKTFPKSFFEIPKDYQLLESPYSR